MIKMHVETPSVSNMLCLINPALGAAWVGDEASRLARAISSTLFFLSEQCHAPLQIRKYDSVIRCVLSSLGSGSAFEEVVVNAPQRTTLRRGCWAVNA